MEHIIGWVLSLLNLSEILTLVSWYPQVRFIHEDLSRKVHTRNDEINEKTFSMYFCTKNLIVRTIQKLQVIIICLDSQTRHLQWIQSWFLPSRCSSQFLPFFKSRTIENCFVWCLHEHLIVWNFQKSAINVGLFRISNWCCSAITILCQPLTS